MEIRKAQRKKAKLRLAITAPSNGGKTRSALHIAMGIGGKVGLIDTESGSGELYTGLYGIGEYDVWRLEKPFTVQKYLQAIKAFENAGYTTIIIDSLSHAWAGTGGLLDIHGKIADTGKGNSYTAWRTVTPQHNDLIDAIHQCKCHLIATMRSKQEYVQEVVDGKKVVKKIGLAPVQREGIEYEFTVVLDMDSSHYATATKDRTGIFDGDYFQPTEETGQKLLTWLETGIDAPSPVVDNSAAELFKEIMEEIKSAKTSEDLAAVKTKIKSLTGEDRAAAIIAGEEKKLAIKAAENEANHPKNESA